MRLTEEQHRHMLRQMLRIRQFEDNLYRMYLARQVPGISPHLSVGQEAVAVGVCTALEDRDYVLTTHRGHGHLLAKGAGMDGMLAEILGKETGYCHGRGGSMHIADVSLNLIGANGIVGGGLPIAVGAALSSKYLNTGAVTVCFFGDAAANTGAFHEALNMAAIWRLPVVWVCENNQYGLSSSSKEMIAGASVAGRASAYGIPGVTVDGNDVLEVRATAVDAVARARTGGGPTLIEALTYRWYGHGASDNRSYRTRDEEQEWKARCPIVRYADRLAREGVVSPHDYAAIESQAAEEVARAIEFATGSPEPSPDAVSAYVFSNAPAAPARA
jgi:acetoin:2,6-dichlorophenolindophenol oxidoreductase subunit alpha